MFCKNCGRQLPDDAGFCPGCGTKRSGGNESYGEGRSGADMKNLPDYAKEDERSRSGFAVDSDRKKFSLSGYSERQKFSLSGNSERQKFSLSGQNKFSLSDQSRKDDGGGIVRLSTGKKPDAPPKEPTGFVNPLKSSGGTVFRNDSARDEAERKTSADAAQAKQQTPAGPNNTVRPPATPPMPPVATTSQNVPSAGSPDSGNADPTGFVNPLKGSDQNIHWGSDGDRNTKAGDFGPIPSHMGFAIIMTVFGGCDCISLILGIIAIVFASKVSDHVQNGNYEEAKRCSNTALTLCWISLGIKILFLMLGSIAEIVQALRPSRKKAKKEPFSCSASTAAKRSRPRLFSVHAADKRSNRRRMRPATAGIWRTTR